MVHLVRLLLFGSLTSTMASPTFDQDTPLSLADLDAHLTVGLFGFDQAIDLQSDWISG